jgi:hypothetical protein
MPKSSAGSTRTRKRAPAAKKVRAATKSKAAAPAVVEAAPRPRRAVFIDVENTSSESALMGALEQLVIDRQAQPTEVFAVGNWRVISHQVARMLRQRGAVLLHSAPATGVKDWSDLAIAVQAGIWLGRSSPGDVIEIISADRAFDAVADAAVTLGVVFHRLTYGVAQRLAASEEDASGLRRRRRGRGRRGGQRSSLPPPRTEAPAAAERVAASAADAMDDEDRHGASHQQIIATVARLTAKDPARGVNLDLLINALKSEGFSRPPGSPRLVTRLRKMKDVEVSQTGMVRLIGVAAPGPAVVAAPGTPAASAPAGEADAEAATPEAAATPEEPKKRSSGRRRGRGGRRRRRGGSSSNGESETPSAAAETAAGGDDRVQQTA